MKKKTVIALIVAASLVFAGACLCALAVAMGAQPGELFSNGTYTLDLDDFDIEVSRNGITGSRSDNVNISTWPGSGESVSVDVKNLELNWLSGSVTILSGGNRLTFSESAGEGIDSGEELQYRVEGKTLYIEYCQSSGASGIFIGGFDLPAKDLVITVPASFGEIIVDTVSADVFVSGVTANTLALSTTSGEINVEGAAVTDAEIYSVSGDAVFKGSAKDIYMENCSGGLRAEFDSLPAEFEAENISGNVCLMLPEGSGFTLEFDTVSGSLSSDFEVRLRDGEYVAGSGGAEVSVDTVSGNCIVEKK